jgi:hypothetical protein
MNKVFLVLVVTLCSTSPLLAQLTNSSRSADCVDSYFLVRNTQQGPPATSILALCQQLRSELVTLWGGAQSNSPWDPLCEIVLHPTLESYVRATAPEAAQTMGCSTIELQAGKVSKRRIDLRIANDGTLPALAHELTHVVLADRFQGRQPPHWLDEGIAMLADTREKQMLHERDCREAMATGRALPLDTLLHLEQFSSAEQMPAFYGQSLSLVNMLVHERPPQQLIAFALECQHLGYPEALKKHYGINSTRELAARWQAYTNDNLRSAPRPLLLSVDLRP